MECENVARLRLDRLIAKFPFDSRSKHGRWRNPADKAIGTYICLIEGNLNFFKQLSVLLFLSSSFQPRAPSAA